MYPKVEVLDDGKCNQCDLKGLVPVAGCKAPTAMDQRSASQSGEYEDAQMVLGDTRLFAAAISRKRAEQDAMLLQNRINLLRQEEAKAQKKIEDLMLITASCDWRTRCCVAASSIEASTH